MPATSYGDINIKQIGAMGNGVNDDTSIFNVAVADLLQSNGGSIYVPPGYYVISSSINTTGAANIFFRGAGLGTSQIIRAPGFAAATFSSLAGVVRVRDLSLPDSQVGGNNGAPAIPATTVGLVNPYPFDCQVNIIAGTITVISIGGIATGLTSSASGVSVVLKPGQTITMTYSVAPTSWTWFGIGG